MYWPFVVLDRCADYVKDERVEAEIEEVVYCGHYYKTGGEWHTGDPLTIGTHKDYNQISGDDFFLFPEVPVVKTR